MRRWVREHVPALAFGVVVLSFATRAACAPLCGAEEATKMAMWVFLGSTAALLLASVLTADEE